MYPRMKATALVAGLAASAMIGSAASAAAQLPDVKERTKITIDKPVEIPGATLQPGAYWFHLINSDNTRENITIQNEDESKTIATVIAVPIYRDLRDTHGVTELALKGTDGPGNAVIDAWFFPGMQYGHQFVYPKDQAKQIAGRIKTVVLADEDGKIMKMNPAGIEEPWAPDPKHPGMAGTSGKSDKSDKKTDKDKDKSDKK